MSAATTAMIATCVAVGTTSAGHAHAASDVLRVVTSFEGNQLVVDGEVLWSGGGFLRPRDVRSGQALRPAAAAGSSGIRSDGRRAFITVRNRRVLVPLDVRADGFRGEPEIVVGSVIYGLAATGGGLWVISDCGSNEEEGCGPELRKLEPSTGQEIARADIEDTVRSLPLAASARRLWTATDLSSDATSAEALAVEERDPQTGRVIRTTTPIGAIQRIFSEGAQLVATARAGWLLDPDGRVYRVPEGGEPRLVGLGYQSIATDGASLWGLTIDGRILRRIDPDTGRTQCEIAGLGASTPPAIVAPLVVGPTRVWTSNTREPGRTILIGGGIASCVKPMVEVSAGQLRINQRISQAAVRRVNALSARLDGRPVPAPAAREGSRRITLSVAQLRINQRISQAAVRRVNALEARFQGEAAPQPSGAEDDGRMTLSAGQLRINQRISQAAVRRVEALEARLAARAVL